MAAFIAPYTVQLDLGEGKKFRMIQVQLCVPVTPRRMRLIYFFYRNVGLFARYIPGHNRLFEWYSDKIINQDVEVKSKKEPPFFLVVFVAVLI